MNNISNFFTLALKKPICIEGLSEESLRQLLDSIEVTVEDSSFGGFVVSSNGTNVKFNFGPDGNFLNVTAKLNNKNIILFNGANSNELSIFKGSPSSTNPGAGWSVEVDLTRQYLNQPTNENNWEIFFASRSSVLNV